jgi:hypothetical protein
MLKLVLNAFLLITVALAAESNFKEYYNGFYSKLGLGNTIDIIDCIQSPSKTLASA